MLWKAELQALIACGAVERALETVETVNIDQIL
jgi:hypothetical protein